MRHRLFHDAPLRGGATIVLAGDERHHARVLRLREGEEVEVFDGRGHNFVARYDSPEAVHLLDEGENREIEIALRLAMAVIQLDKFEWVLQKATELGVHTITPLICDRVEVRPERYRGKTERWQKIVLEAVKQSGRSRIPPVESPARFDDLIGGEGVRIVFEADAEPGRLARGNATLFIGPEGGWSDRELGVARTAGASFQRLGPRRLRAETAAVAAMTIASLG